MKSGPFLPREESSVCSQREKADSVTFHRGPSCPGAQTRVNVTVFISPALISHSAVQTATGPLYALYEINAFLCPPHKSPANGKKAGLTQTHRHPHTQGSQLTLPDFFIWIIILINLSGYLLTQELEAEMDFSPSSPRLTFSSSVSVDFLFFSFMALHLSSTVLHLLFLLIFSPLPK